MHQCDVLIVGAGPAGLSVASSLSNEISCIIVHQDAEVGRPVRTSGGSFLKDAKALCIPEKYYQIIDSLDFYSDHAEAKFIIETDKMVIFDITGLYQYLASLLQSKNRQLLMSTKFLNTEKLLSGTYLSTIRSKDGGKKTIRSKYIIDASGWHCAVVQACGLIPPPKRLGIGIEYEFTQDDFPKNRAALFVGSPVLAGYGWVFPTHYNTVRLGVGVIKPDTNANPRHVMSRLLASGFLDRIGVRVPDEYEINSGIVPAVAFQRKLVFGNIIRVGDSANCATPIAGEGIRIAIEQGRLLGTALSKAIGQQSRRSLQAFEKAYADKYARDYKIGFWANQRIAGYGPDDWDRSVKRISRLTEAQITELLHNRFNLRDLLRTALLHLKRKLLDRK